jgi:hypothetical protein
MQQRGSQRGSVRTQTSSGRSTTSRSPLSAGGFSARRFPGALGGVSALVLSKKARTPAQTQSDRARVRGVDRRPVISR